MAMLPMAMFAHGYMAVAPSHIVANGHKPWLMAISRENQQIPSISYKTATLYVNQFGTVSSGNAIPVECDQPARSF